MDGKDRGTSRTLTVNGITRPSAAATLAALLEELSVTDRAVVAEVNGKIIAHADFGDTPLADGDSIELVRFVGGG